MSTTPAGHPCELCDVVKPSAYALNDHMANVHPEQFEEWRNRQRPRPRPSIVADLLGYVAANLPDEQPQRAAVEKHPADGEQPRPHTPTVGDRYVKRADHDAGRIVTVDRVWTDDDGHTAVAYWWPDPRASYAGSACPLDVFHRTYQPETEPRLALLDGRDALAFVIIRPANDDPDRIAVEANAHGMSKAAAAYVLRQLADEFDEAALAEGDEPIPYTLTGQAETALAEQANEEQLSRAHVVDYNAQTNTPECVEDCPGCEAQQ